MSKPQGASQPVKNATATPKRPALTLVQREVLEALASGALMTVDRTNSSWIGDKAVTFQTRALLAQQRLITRCDPSRNADAAGNGFTISAKGRSVLATLPGPKPKPEGASDKAAAQPKPPSEAQLAYARDLGIQVPPNAKTSEVSALISRHTDRDVEPLHEQLAWANFFHVEHTRYVGRHALMESLRFTLARPSREADLVRWFAFCVGAWLGPALQPELTRPDDPRLERVCDALLAHDGALRSIRRYAASEELWLLARGEASRLPRVSTETTACRLAAALFRVTREGP